MDDVGPEKVAQKCIKRKSGCGRANDILVSKIVVGALLVYIYLTPTQVLQHQIHVFAACVAKGFDHACKSTWGGPSRITIGLWGMVGRNATI
jgi:hypothetical protein